MKKIYKITISILIISILTTVAISAVGGPYTGCVATRSGKFVPGIFYNFQPGSTPISTCNYGDNQITVYEKTYIDNALNNLQIQIKNFGASLGNLTTRVNYLENNQSYNAVLMYTDPYIHWYEPNPQHTEEIAIYSFYIPTQSYVDIESSGDMNGFNISAWAFMQVDDNIVNYSNPNPTMATYQPILPYDDGTVHYFTIQSFKISGAYNLSSGWHTVYVFGGYDDIDPMLNAPCTPSGETCIGYGVHSIIVSINQKGSLTQMTTPASHPIGTISSLPTGLVTKTKK